MCKNNGWIYLIVYFIMFPLGFQGAKLLDRWLNCRITIHVLQLNKEKAETSILC